MIARALFLGLSLVVTAALASADDAVRCAFTATPTSAEIGQPVALQLVVEHPRGARAVVDDAWAPPEGEWITYDRRPAITRDLEGGRAATTIAWTVAAIDAGEMTLDAPAVACEVDGVAHDCAGAAVTLTIASALTDADEGPRPAALPPAELTPEERAAASRYVSPWWFAALPLLGLGAVLVVALARRAPRGPVAPPAPTADQRLSALAPDGDAAEYCAALRAALRDGWDASRGVDLAGRTDAEWIEQHDFDDARRARIAELLARCEAVRFGGERPTRFALAEWRDAARELLPAEEGGEGRPEAAA